MPLGKGRVRPVALTSMGLTNDPNIPVPALANEADETPAHTEPTENEIMNPEILAALGLEEGATPEEVLAKITALSAAAKAAADEKAAAETKATEAEEAKTGAEAQATEAEEKKTEAENALATAQGTITTLQGQLTIAANDAVARAVAAGRITPAEAEAKATEILAANDFKAALKELASAPLKFKTASATGDLGSAKSRLVIAANDESVAARNERAVLVANEYVNTNPALSEGERKRIAWQRAQKKNPELFGKKDSSGSAA